jgi:tetratricopeptide (TPR) repeat protein
MKRLRRALLFAAWTVALGTSVSRADQHDPSLEPLFEALASTPSPREAARIESAIWARWLDSGDQEVDRLMLASMRAVDAGRVDVALDVLDDIVAAMPDFAEAWNQRATALYVAHEYDAALADIEHVLELEPRHFGALSGRGLIHLATGHDYEALLAFEAVLRINPHAREARRYVDFLRRRLHSETV